MGYEAERENEYYKREYKKERGEQSTRLKIYSAKPGEAVGPGCVCLNTGKVVRELNKSV
jgi:hypothetical protein